MITSACLSLIANALGIVGTAILFKSSYSLEPSQGAYFGDMCEHDEQVRKANITRANLQRVGFTLLCLSFCISSAALFI